MMLQKDIMDRLNRLPENNRQIILELVNMTEDSSKTDRAIRDRIEEDIEQVVMKERAK
ncbi:hypothetical protein ABC634_11475 [Lentilactobacillus parabuchneri]|uniref:hypothetical protein n=2 Tax=Lentilactobacillus parabuchneri TaxID=152331 RepID=UPI0015C4AA44|nr:hypothetical protein [Lentilactobacillus parabuchneri]MDB1104371.1 hypothetical protein [Lentilactobacillus parabuchneri]